MSFDRKINDNKHQTEKEDRQRASRKSTKAQRRNVRQELDSLDTMAIDDLMDEETYYDLEMFH